jgi:hypothetical protein
MALSNSSLLRCGTALCAIVLTLFGGLTVYTSQLATREVMRYLGPGRYDWAGVLVRSGSEQPERHGIDLSYDFSGEIAMLVAAFGSVLAGVMCVAKIGIEERVRRRWNGDGMVRLLRLGLLLWHANTTKGPLHDSAFESGIRFVLRSSFHRFCRFNINLCFGDIYPASPTHRPTNDMSFRNGRAERRTVQMHT